MERFITKDLLKWKNKLDRKPMLLLGVRQVGKTYILQKFGSQHFPAYHSINFEKDPSLAKIFEPDLKPRRIIEELSFYLDRPLNISEDLIIFDEIQACPNALTSLKYFKEDLPEAYICGAGSLLGIHLGPVSFPVGKVDMLSLQPMSFMEFLMANKDQKSLDILNRLDTTKTLSEIVHKHLWGQLKHYFVVGGMPEAVSTYCKNKENLFKAFSLVREKQDELIIAYYADMVKHSGKINAMHIDRVFRSIPSQLEKEQNGSSGKFKFKGVIPGVSHYSRIAGAIDWLIAAGLVLKVNIVNSGNLPLQAYTKENTFKLLLFDIGILGSMGGLSPRAILDYDYGSYKGYFAENFVAQELVCSGISKLFCWTEKTAEVEFLTEIDGNTIPIEVKSGHVTKAKSLKVFSEKYKPPYQVIISGKSLNIDLENGVHSYPLYLSGNFPLPSIAL